MRTRVSARLGLEAPILAFSHCRDVVAEVSRAGGMGVLGAVGFTPEQLEVELAWIDEHVGGRPYGVDFIMPQKKLDLAGGADGDALRRQAEALLPAAQRAFVDELIERFALAPLPEGEVKHGGVVGWTDGVAHDLVDVALAHPVALVANALGSPPPDVIERAHEHGAVVAALAGRVAHAERHVRNGVDIVIAQGTEAGGHTGDIATMVLVPEVVEAVGADALVLAAGGIATGRQMAAAIALGADGVWTGSVWLTTAESDARPEQLEKYLAASSSDTVRSKSYTGKPARMLRTAWTDAWEEDGAPPTLPMPLQNILISEASSRFARSGRMDEFFAPVGQVVGQLRKVRPVRDVVFSMIEDYLDAIERLNRTTGE